MRNLLIGLLMLTSLESYSQKVVDLSNHFSISDLADSLTLVKIKVDHISDNIRKSDSLADIRNNTINYSLDSIRERISDKKLEESRQSAESTINKLDTIIDSFGVIYAILSIAIILLTIGLPFAIRELSIKPLKKEIQDDHSNIVSEIERCRDLRIKLKEEQLESGRSIDSMLKKFDADINKMYNTIQTEFEDKFKSELLKHKKYRMDQALINLASDHEIFLRDACSFISQSSINELEDEHYFKIVRVLKKQNLSNDRIEMLIYKISIGKKSDFTDDFFESLPSLSKINNINTRSAAFYYFAGNGLEKYRPTIIRLIHNSENPTEEYCRVLSYWQSGYQDKIVDLLNYDELNDSTKIDFRTVHDRLNKLIHFEELKSQIEQTDFNRKFNASLQVESPN